ncbi:response regulator transcription factor [Paenibacillus sp. P96]|uniref:Response regulator transcription factor n=1 Tax=Paenibacillus zeirhizosphaerae TaxID=2987519 RepID=A0ABT9FN70_9BACL|nr:response regulator transcription factor [Paenibacillus sp. P96]MDP4096175.1 response regulator transcription factor [Paenibacillus sp. P96]
MPKQTNQVNQAVTRVRLPGTVRARFAPTAPAPANQPLQCTTTRRIALISAVPGVVQVWVRMLTDACYDVMAFHRWSPELQAQLSPDLILFDATVFEDAFELKLWHESLEEGARPRIYLVNDALMEAAQQQLPHEELVSWPAASTRPVQRIERILSGRLGQKEQAVSGSRIVFKDIWIDRGKMTVYQGERLIGLTKTEYDLLLKLIEAQGRVISREQMMHDIWDTDFIGGSNVVDVHVKSLRKKLGDNAAAPHYITTVRGVGYRLAD